MDKTDNKEKGSAGSPASSAEDVAKTQAAADAEYDKAFEEAGKAEAEAAGKTKDAQPQSATEEDEKEKAPLEEKPEGEKTPQVGETEAGADKGKDDLTSLQKVYDETKGAFDRLKKENAELRRQAEASQRGEGDPEALKKAKAAVAEAEDNFDALKSKVLVDYPELQGFIEATATHIRNLRGELGELKKEKEKDKEKDAQEEARRKAMEAFNANVKPRILEEHKDFDAIMGDPGYWAWAEKQRPSVRFAAMASDDPEDIKDAIRAYKVFKATPEAEATRERDKKIKDERLQNAQSMRPGSAPLTPAGGKGKKDPKDYDGGWDEAGAVLQAEGVVVR